MYIRNFFKENAKEEAEEMVSYIREIFNTNLETLDWMDDVTRKRAISKAEAMKPLIGYPKELLDEKFLEEHYKGVKLSLQRRYINK